MNSMRLTHKRSSHKTLWIGFFGAITVIVGTILFGYAQEQKKETEKMNPTKAIPSDTELRTKLTKDQYHVTREGGTETAFQNAYWDNHQAGIYVDLITGEPLFSSLDKFDSGTGWSRLRGWAGADRPTILRQLGRDAFYSGGKIKGRRLRRISVALSVPGRRGPAVATSIARLSGALLTRR